MDGTIYIATIAATSAMTLFSYVISWMFRQPFKEPLLLAVLLNNFQMADSKTLRVIGWVLHYLLGLFFVVGFELFVNAGWLEINSDSALVYGIGIGVLGIAGWKTMFRFSARKPEMDYTGFYMQLFIAHIIFSFAMVGSYKVLYYL